MVRKVVLLDKQDRYTSPRRIASDTRTVYAASNHEQIPSRALQLTHSYRSQLSIAMMNHYLFTKSKKSK